MTKIDFSKLKLPRQTIPEDIAKQLISVQPMPDNLVKEVLDAVGTKTIKFKVE